MVPPLVLMHSIYCCSSVIRSNLISYSHYESPLPGDTLELACHPVPDVILTPPFLSPASLSIISRAHYRIVRSNYHPFTICCLLFHYAQPPSSLTLLSIRHSMRSVYILLLVLMILPPPGTPLMTSCCSRFATLHSSRWSFTFLFIP